MLVGVLIEPTHEFAAIKLGDDSLGVRMESMRHAIGCATYRRIPLPDGLGMWVDAEPDPALPVNEEATALVHSVEPIRGNVLVFAASPGHHPQSVSLDQMATIVGLWRAATLGGDNPEALRPRMALV